MTRTQRRDRHLVVIAHPDDELIGCAAMMSRLADVALVQVSTGAPIGTDHHRRAGFDTPAAYAEARWRETLSALSLTGMDAARVYRLSIDDQRIALNLVAVTRALVPHIASADVVLTHTYETGHPDHDAVCFAVHAARTLIAGLREPTIVEMPLYHGSEGGRTYQRFLPAAGAGPEWREYLSKPEVEMKMEMAACHRSQASSLSGFEMGSERFRLAGRHDFTRPAHAGPSLYPHYGGMTPSRWAEIVTTALHELGLAPPPAPGGRDGGSLHLRGGYADDRAEVSG